ncbi:flavin reductase family protein [Sulfitobacter aestuarii]|uniref:Flavin reductase family protein n=1 Tax=Sulfitobacter aestuarii TaxID=2161676 RepID=A0ABW5TZ39_9RHOB
MSGRMQSFVPDPDAADELRRAFGRFGTGVTVITVQSPQGPLGMTANSFSSVSLDPPLVLWSPATRSKRHDAFATAAQFCVHVLRADQLDLANHFASDGLNFDRFAWTPGPNGAPTLTQCLASFHCDTYAVHPAGDHSLILGHVRHAAVQDGDAPGLMFDRGRYGTFAPED